MGSSAAGATGAVSLGNGYRAEPDRFDEAVDANGRLRPTWARLAVAGAAHDPLSHELPRRAELQRRADRLLDAEGAGHLVHELALEHGERTVPGDGPSWRLDPLPYVLDREEFEQLARGATQRMLALEALLADVYGPRRLVAERVIPAAELYSWPSFRPWPAIPGRRWLVTYAVDLARDATGRWRVVRDVTDAPGGLGASLLARSVVSRLMPEALRDAGVQPINRHFDVLRRALLAAAPPGRISPRCVVLTPGPASTAFVEHAYLAAHLGYHLVEGADLVMRDSRLWLRALDGLEQVDVLFRRVTDEHLDPLEARTRSGIGVPGLVWGAARDGISVVNAPGVAVASEPLVADVLDAVARHALGQSLQIAQLSAGARLASTPATNADGTVSRSTSFVLRLHLVAGPDGIDVMPGATARSILDEGDTPAVFKDVWITGDRRSVASLIVRPPPAPQVDLFSSLPKRAADSLYWLGRAAERAEVAARTTREVRAQLARDPGLAVAGDGAWATAVLAMLRSAQGLPSPGEPTDGTLREQLDASLDGVVATVVRQLATVVRSASGVREFLSTTTGRVLGRLAATRSALAAGGSRPGDLDALLVDLAALAGLSMESTVRGPAWRFHDIGRRLERALAVLGSIEAALGPAVDAGMLQPLAESVLAANESLVAYRRRYRSDVALDAVAGLLTGDDTNPRGASFQIDRLREHMAALGWTEGLELVDRAGRGLLTAIETIDTVEGGVVNGRRPTVDALVLQARGPLLALSDAIGRRWFADPVSPTVIGGR